MKSKLEKRDSQIQELQKEIIDYEIKTNKLKIIDWTLVFKKDGKYITTNVKSDEIKKYILTPIGELLKNIPNDYEDFAGENFNENFYAYRCKIIKIYKAKAEKELEYRMTHKSIAWSRRATMVAGVGLILSIIAICIEFI